MGASIDQVTGKIVRLFHPRKDKWAVHFMMHGSFIAGRTAIGRATVRVLNVNDPLTVELREAMSDEQEM